MHGARGFIQLLSLGGTIAQGPAGTLKPASLIKMARTLPPDIPVRGTDANLTDAPDRIAEVLGQPGCLGVVVALNFSGIESLIRELGAMSTPNVVPIVLTGAAIPPRSAGTDAPGNITDAIRVVCDRAAQGLGVLVVAQGRIHAAAEVGFGSIDRGPLPHSEPLGPIGLVTPQGVEIVRRPNMDAQLAGGR